MRFRQILFALAILAAVTTVAAAQRGGGRGNGRGRGGVRAMTLTSTGFADGAQMPAKYAQPGDEVSPPLAWTGAPDSTSSFVLVFRDLDAPFGASGTDEVVQWLVWNIPGKSTALPEHVPQGPTLPDGTCQISVSGPYYRGAAAAASGPVHHYVFELYALDTVLTVAPVGATPAATRTAVAAAMSGHVRGKAVMSVLYRRPS